MSSSFLFVFTLILPMLLPAFAHAGTWQGRVSDVTDGDTLLVSNDSRVVVIRLAEIDAPENAQPWGSQATRALGDLVADQIVTIHERDTDRYGRTVAQLKVGGLDVAEELVRQGHAWHYTRYSDNAHLAELQAEARTAQVGLWSQPAPIAPWDYRQPSGVSGLVQRSGSASALATRVAANGFSCGGKRYCKQMASCEEAYFYLTRCGLYRLDGDSDGIPCEVLC